MLCIFELALILAAAEPIAKKRNLINKLPYELPPQHHQKKLDPRTFINLIDPVIPTSVMTATVGAWAIAQIVWVIFLFIPDQKNYPALVPIRWFSFGFLMFLVLGIVPLLIKPSNPFALNQLLSISYAVPYFFVIWFAMSIATEQVTVVDERGGVVEDSRYLEG